MFIIRAFRLPCTTGPVICVPAGRPIKKGVFHLPVLKCSAALCYHLKKAMRHFKAYLLTVREAKKRIYSNNFSAGNR
ncbi:hypothetical protein BEL04_10790 [Mucilaginibacter sp. PPCGB 2223]|nr:hypothetical protein BEL04_10790 [Mucilaginibacter sp. PPCGB 2223]